MKYLFLPSLLCLSIFSYAQTTADMMYSIVNTKCSNSTCHSSTSYTGIRFDDTKANVLNALLGKTPANGAAAVKGDKYVKVNQPYESYLLRKCGSWLDSDLALATDASEGAAMTDVNGNRLSEKEVEYMRQWIMNGAKTTGVTIDTAIINRYYNANLADRAPFLSKPPKPVNGKQIRFGPVFLPEVGQPNTEREYLLKYHVDFGNDVEVSEVNGYMNAQSHHFLLFKYFDSVAAAAQPNGIRIVNLGGGNTVTSFDGDKDLTAAWQDDADIVLPAGTAIFWDKNTYLDLNYHVKNYNSPTVMPCDFYFNVNYKPRLINTTTVEMKSALVNNVGLLLTPGANTLYYNDPSNNTNETRHIWMMSSHTHKFGTGFDIFVRDNTQPNQVGDMLYDGTYRYETAFQGTTYDWEHPSVKYFDPQYPVNMQANGIRCKTSWNNTSSSIVRFGFTTNEEMQLYYYMYTNQLAGTVGIKESATNINASVATYPNPSNGNATIQISTELNETVELSLVNIHGQVVGGISTLLHSGQNTFSLNQINENLASGMYVLKVKGQTIAAESKLIVN
jgi:hypothetical protein